jgi:hypothetical protein
VHLGQAATRYSHSQHAPGKLDSRHYGWSELFGLVSVPAWKKREGARSEEG